MSGQMQAHERAFAPGRHSLGRDGAARFAATSSLRTDGRFGARLFSCRVVLRQSDVVFLFLGAAILGLWLGSGPL